MNEKKKVFAEAYLRLCNATQAAKEAGYTDKNAANTGSRLLRDPQVRQLIVGNRIDRIAHGEITYRNLMTVAGVALEELKESRLPQDEIIEGQVVKIKNHARLNRAIHAATEALVQLGKCEGIFTPVGSDERKATDGQASQTNIQINFIDRVRESIKGLKPDEIAEYEALVTRIERRFNAPALDDPTDPDGAKLLELRQGLVAPDRARDPAP